MKGRVYIKKRYFIILILLMTIILLGPSFLGGYFWTERSAIRDSFPNEDGTVVFEKDFKNKKVVIWDTGQNKYIKLIENNFLYRPILVSGIDAKTSDKKMNVTWSATNREGEIYDTLFAAEVLDEDIVKVIVSNEKANLEGEKLSLKEVEEQSTIFVELDVNDGVAAHYILIPYLEVGNFIFRGVDAEGNVVSIF
ncbi:hypothetical protein [Sporosarcina sp. UB5]|uniref:hypothetical protein n=1 Tax=Sporosarcina sp. UB5 TaxID=3047463 RepID=UPI003D7BB40F